MCGIRASHISCTVGHEYLMTQGEGSDSKICNITKCLVKTKSLDDEKCSLTFYTRVHHGSLDPILASEKRPEVGSCLAHGNIFSG